MRFKKGESGNPAGRPPKERAISAILERIGSEAYQDITKREAMLRIIYDMALGGDLAAAKFIADRTEGTPIQTVREVQIERDELIEI